MKVDGTISANPADAVQSAKETAAAGFDGGWVAETGHDPFLACALAAEHTATLEIGTSIAVAFARSPMTLAATANDLHQFSCGRFNLGIGSQVKAHIERRYSMPWSQPAARMREYVAAMRAIWAAWHEDEPLKFEGDFYSHTLMPPFFSPGHGTHGAPRVLLAGVGEKMTCVAGEVCDGFLVHPFTTERYLREITIPALKQGREQSNRSDAGFQVSALMFIVTSDTEEGFEAARTGTRNQIAFYGSTPAYRTVLDQHGWGDLQAELHSLTKAGRWSDLGALITDDMLDTFAVVGEPHVIAPELQRRYGDVVDRITFDTPYSVSDEVLAIIRADLQGNAS